MNRKAILAEAFFKVSKILDIEQSYLEGILGLSHSAITNLKVSGELDPYSKSGQKALLLIHIFKLLHVLSGGDEELMKSFMYTYNFETNDIPIRQVQSEEGMIKVRNFLEFLISK